MRLMLYQNCIFNDHFLSVQPGFEALDFRHNPRPELREFQIFQEIYEQGLHTEFDVTGAVSSRFQAKSLLHGKDVKKWIEANPHSEVYGVNPYPQLSYASFNSHERPGIIHQTPAFSKMCQKVLSLAGIALDFENIGRQHNGNYFLSSYWFGTPHFWEKFMTELVLPVIHLTKAELGSELFDFLYSPLPYYGVSNHRAGALPFLLERATSLYILAQFPDSVAIYPQSRERVLACCVFPFERELVTFFGDQVDEWDDAGVYDRNAIEYFRYANAHSTAGWLAYTTQYSIDFSHGDPRPALPWFCEAEAKFGTTGV